MREAAAAVICDEQHVFNAHAALARDVDARLVGDDHARLTDGLIGLIEARPLVNLEAYAVAEAVTERVRVRGLDDVARDLIHIAAAHARACAVDNGELAFVAPADECLCGTATLIEQLAQTKGIPVTRVDIPAQLKGALFLVSDEHGVVPADDTDAAATDAATVAFFAEGYEKLRARR